MKRILVRADDLGYSEGVNYGIAQSVQHGIIRSVGVMPNMPAAHMGYPCLPAPKFVWVSIPISVWAAP